MNAFLILYIEITTYIVIYYYTYENFAGIDSTRLAQ